MANATGSFIESNQIAKKPRHISFAAFQKKYAARVDGFKYEWNDGFIEKTDAMKQDEFYIATNLTKFFFLFIEPRIGGTLIQEGETWTTKTKWRKPDLAFYTSDQMLDMDNHINAIPTFCIEIVSKNDDVNDVLDKNIEYFRAGVKVVWWIFPKQKQVHVYNSYNDVMICDGDTICSAEAAVPNFSLTVDAIFKK
jgi:Uma2 family endonuclease